MQTKITDLVNAGRFRDALDGLAGHPKRDGDDERYEQHLNMMIGTLTGIETDEMDGTASREFTLRQKAKLRKSIGLFVRMFGITHVEAQPVVVQEPRITNPAPPEKPVDKPVILFLGSNPKGWGKLQLDAEYVNIQERMGKKKALFDLRTAFRTTSGELMETLLNERPMYLHFAGHGVPDAGEDDPAGIVLETEDKQPQVVSGEALSAMFSLMVTEFKIKSVVLNACDTIEQARAISTNGVHSVGMSEEIPDDVAISFAGGFYLGLAQKPGDIPRAFKYALTMLKLSFSGQDDLPKLFYAGSEVNV